MSHLNLSGRNISAGVVALSIDGELQQSNITSDSEIFSTREGVSVQAEGNILVRTTGPTSPEVALKIYATNASRPVSLTSTAGNIGNASNNTYVELGTSGVSTIANVMASLFSSAVLD